MLNEAFFNNPPPASRFQKIKFYSQGLLHFPNGKYPSPDRNLPAFESRAGIERILDCGVPESQLWLDPGFGFGKTPEQNLEIVARLREVAALGAFHGAACLHLHDIVAHKDVVTVADAIFRTIPESPLHN